jgi:hypothetical protein
LEVRYTSKAPVVPLSILVNNLLEVPANFSVISPVPKEPLPGTMLLSVHELPPSVDTYIGALEPPIGLGVNAEAASCEGLLGLMAILGSLSWLVSPLKLWGIMLMIFIDTIKFAGSLGDGIIC